MAKPTKTTVFKTHVPGPETTMDKTTRIVREIVDKEAEQRQAKIARLRKTRLEREANTPKETTPAARKTRSPKPVKK